jgi:decaprenyl-phosphate phosphoribosyltransferase
MIKTMRPKQWVKNLFVLAPIVFAKDLFQEQVLLRALLAFGILSVLAGAIYTINDLVDVEDDRQPPDQEATDPSRRGDRSRGRGEGIGRG